MSSGMPITGWVSLSWKTILSGEGRQVRFVLARVEDADGVVQGCGDEEVLLLETQRLAGLHVLRVVRTNLVVRLNRHQAALRAASTLVLRRVWPNR